MPNFVYHEKGHRYELDGRPMTGVTTVLGVLAKPALIGWAAKQTAEWIRENCVKSPANLEHWSVSEDNLQEAVKAHTKKKEAGGDKGKLLHSEVERYIKECMETHGGEPFTLNGDESANLTKFMNWAQENHVKFLASEKAMYSKEWFVAGTADFFFEKDGKIYCGDLKSYKKIWDKVPAYQCAAYAKMWTEMGNTPVDGTCIVNISESGELTDQWFHDLEEDTKCFEAALRLYRSLQNF